MERGLLLLVPGWVSGAVSAAQTVASVDVYGFVRFGAIDSDSNGYVSRVEARSVTGVEQVFDAADTNGDGLLDRKEYQRVRPDGEVR